MKTTSITRLVFFFIIILVSSNEVNSQNLQKLNANAAKKLKSLNNPLKEWQHVGKLKIDSVRINNSDNSLRAYYSQTLSYYPMREDSYLQFVNSLKSSLGRKYRKYDIKVFTNGFSLEQLIPNYYRKTIRIDSSRFRIKSEARPVLIKKVDFDG